MKFYFMPGVTDMRIGYHRLTEIVRTQYGRNPKNGDCYFFISKDQRRIRIFRYECEPIIYMKNTTIKASLL